MYKFPFLILKVWQCSQQLKRISFSIRTKFAIPKFNLKHCRAGARQAYCQVAIDCLRRTKKKKRTIGNSIGHNATITHVMATSMQNLQMQFAALLYLRSIQLPALLDFETLKDMCLPSKSIIARREQWLTFCSQAGDFHLRTTHPLLGGISGSTNYSFSMYVAFHKSNVTAVALREFSLLIYY